MNSVKLFITTSLFAVIATISVSGMECKYDSKLDESNKNIAVIEFDIPQNTLDTSTRQSPMRARMYLASSFLGALNYPLGAQIEKMLRQVKFAIVPEPFRESIIEPFLIAPTEHVIQPIMALAHSYSEPIALIIVGPVLEEIAYRQILQQWILNKIPNHFITPDSDTISNNKLAQLGRILISATLFSLNHCRWYEWGNDIGNQFIVGNYIFGLACASVQELTGDVKFPVLMHMVANGMNFIAFATYFMMDTIYSEWY